MARFRLPAPSSAPNGWSYCAGPTSPTARRRLPGICRSACASRAADHRRRSGRHCRRDPPRAGRPSPRADRALFAPDRQGVRRFSERRCDRTARRTRRRSGRPWRGADPPPASGASRSSDPIELPFPALGLSRRVLDEALLRRAEASGARLRLGHAVRQITRERKSWLNHTRDRDPVVAEDVFLATGKHELRDLARPGAARGAVGFKMYFRLAPAQTAALTGEITLICSPAAMPACSAWRQGKRCCASHSAVPDSGDRRHLVRPAGSADRGEPPLDRILDGAQPLLPRPLAVAGVPYGFLHRESPATATGLFRLGDQVAVIPSLTGDGVAIALHSGTLAARAWLGGDRCRPHIIVGLPATCGVRCALPGCCTAPGQRARSRRSRS